MLPKQESSIFSLFNAHPSRSVKAEMKTAALHAASIKRRRSSSTSRAVPQKGDTAYEDIFIFVLDLDQ
jgi:hypothetical protein